MIWIKKYSMHQVFSAVHQQIRSVYYKLQSFFFLRPLTPLSSSTYSLIETCTPSWSCIDPHITLPPTTTLPLQALRSLASQLGHMQVMVLIRAKSGLNLGQT